MTAVEYITALKCANPHFDVADDVPVTLTAGDLWNVVKQAHEKGAQSALCSSTYSVAIKIGDCHNAH